MSQLLRPSGDIYVENWYPYSEAFLYDEINEIVANDDSAIYFYDVSGVYDVGLTSGQTPANRDNHILRFRYVSYNSQPSYLKVQLLQSTNEIFSVVKEDAGLTIQQSNNTLSAAQASGISDYGNLSLRFTGSGIGEQVDVTWAQLEIPDLPNCSGSIPLYCYGHASSSGSIPLYLLSTDSSSGNIDLYLMGHLPSSGNIDLYLEGHPPTSGNIDLYLEGPLLATVSGSIDLFGQVSDTAPCSGILNLYVGGRYETYSDSINLYVENWGTTNSINLYARGDGYGSPFAENSCSASLNLYIERNTADYINLFLCCNDSSSGTVYLYGMGHDVGSGSIDLFCSGLGQYNNSLELFTHGYLG